MDPRTAPARRSIWGPLEEAQFQRNIGKLWKITHGQPKDPQTYPLPTESTTRDDVVPITVELQLAKGVAFISAAKKGVESVTAVAIEQPQNPSQGLRLNLAANEEIRPGVKDRMDEVAAILRETAREDKTRDQCKDGILELIVRLNQARIDGRLKSKRSLYIVRDGLLDILTKATSQSGHRETLSSRLQTLCTSLGDYCNRAGGQKTIEDVKRLVVACYAFFEATTDGESVTDMLRQVGVDVDGSRGNPHLRQIGKIASYCHIAETLSTIASHQEYRRFCVNLSIRYVCAYKTVPSPIPAVDGGSRDCHVHAEVQLVVDQDLRGPSDWRKPRAIASSKAACFLCELFINGHGTYFVPRTHGKLTPHWTIPDLDRFSPTQRSRYQNIIGSMNRELQRLIKIPHPRRLDAAMSWQTLSQLNLFPYSPPSANHNYPSLPLVQIVPAIPGPLETGGTTSASGELQETAVAAINQDVKLLTAQAQSDTRASPIRNPIEEPGGPYINNEEQPEGHLLPRNALIPKLGISYSSPGIGEIPGLQHSPGQITQRQVRSCMSLDSEQLVEAPRVIRDHKSRTCDMPSERGMHGRPRGQCSTPRSDGMSRKIDFHDMELFLEIEYPATAQIIIIQCSRPDRPESHRVIEVDKIKPGATLEVDTGGDLAQPRVMFLTMRDDTGIERWWECRWKRSG
ncbi:uncharacterized protein Z519_09132 [Cladophialophora bantiana CBS 173.52]|uniref:Uncharacterized protein n=1 Tax=Cladophialophora bantiana (strain ATCC 10958 / CBS 173.52 / CDC B-1940 / NIH 8579) TaxID=1442370 RepID=A0A0D2EKH7_CLAB1|nr:uncharacterized protein Z519_09132 [Cladophialophora bantiana CBS 173.52]KIW90486.1 hypothetical protein Z519_09132 [Cladophialophora bantiana CBS 173.52]